MHARCWAIVAVCGLAGPVMGQYALDRNLQVGSGGINGPGRDFKKEMEFRNAIVTGNAPGGISFRGDVGYRAPGEFFGSLGSNDTFTFRRDSAYSGLGGVGIRGTEALQYQFAVTTGNAPPGSLSGIPTYGRSGGGFRASDVVAGAEKDGLSGATRAAAFGDDSRALSLMSMRSPSAYVANRGLQPTLLGRAQEGSQTKAVTASMLRGVAYDNIDMLGKPKGKEEKKQPPGSVNTTLPTGVPTTQAQSTEIAMQARTAYDDLTERIKMNTPEAKPGGAGANETPGDKKKEDVPEWQRRINELREQLSDKTRPPKKAVTPAKPEEKPAPKPPQGEGEGKDGESPGAPRATKLDSDTASIIKRAGERITTLAGPSFDAFGSQMKLAQEHLAAGRYFDAEERFTSALSAKPGDPMAMVGRIHAQLGAGMFLSAAINLRGLLTEHPELASTRYTERLLPIGERRGRVMERLAELVTEQGERGREPALLMAYLGYQTGDRAAMERGLAAMSAGGGADPDQLARLGTLLRQVWTDAAPDAKPPVPIPLKPEAPK